MSKRKIIAIILFNFLGLFLFTYISPGDVKKQDPENQTKIEDDRTDIKENITAIKNETNIGKDMEDIKKHFVSTPNITITPEEIVILHGDDYNLMRGLSINTKNKLSITTNITDTTTLKVGKHHIIYSAIDTNGKQILATRTVIVLEPEGDDDKDGFTNEEELKTESNPLNEDNTPKYSKELAIDFSNCRTSMVVYDEIPDFNSCVTVTDEFYGTEGIDFTIDTSNINKNNVGIYKVKVIAHDKLENETEKEFDYEVVKRKVNIIIDNKKSIYLDKLDQLTSNEKDVTVDGTDIGVKLSSEVTNKSNVGNYEITGTYENKNYDVTFEKGTYSITPKQLDQLNQEDIKNMFGIEYNNVTKTYDGKEHQNIITGETPSDIEVKYKNNKGIDSGIYNSVATLTGTKNYTGQTTLDATLTLEKAPLTIKVEDKNITYGDATEELTYTITNGQIYGADNLNVTLTREDEQNNNVGSYEITGTYENKNYDVKFINGRYTIKKAIPTYVIPTGLTGEEDVTLTEIELPDGFTYQDDFTVPLSPGTYPVKLTYTPNDKVNYEIITDIETEVVINATYYTITFVDRNNNILSTQTVRKNKSAIEPEIEEEYEVGNNDYIFSGWIGNYIEVTADAIITPLYIRESTSSTYAYVLKPEYYMPENGAGYNSSYYTNALETEDGDKISLSIKIGGLTEEQANSIVNQQTTIVALGEENVMKYLTKSTKEQLATVTKGVDENGAYTIEWYVLKYQPDGWHLDGYKVYDTITLNLNYDFSDSQLALNFNNAVKDVTVTIDDIEQTVINSSNSSDIGNEYIIYYENNDTEKNIKVNYKFKDIEYTKEYILTENLITEISQNKLNMVLPMKFSVNRSSF